MLYEMRAMSENPFRMPFPAFLSSSFVYILHRNWAIKLVDCTSTGRCCFGF